MSAKVHGFELSAQQRYLYALHKHQSHYCSQSLIVIDGSLKKSALRRALQDLISRHESLRTGFARSPETTSVLQVVSDDPSLAWEEIDLRLEGQQEQARRICAQQLAERARSFNLEQPPMVRASLLQQSETRHMLLLTTLALCADGSTLDHMLEELAALYEDPCAHPGDDVVQYVDFSEWQNQEFANGAEDIGRWYWTQQELPFTSDSPLLFEQPDDDPGPVLVDSVELVLDPALTSRIETIAASYSTTAEQILAVAWHILHWKTTHGAAMLLGYKFHGRHFADIHKAFGAFAQVLPIYAQLQPDSTFGDCIIKMSQRIAEAIGHYSLFDWSLVTRAQDLAPTIPVCFEYRQHARPIAKAGLRFETQQQFTRAERYKLKLACTRREHEIQASIYYDASRFTHAAVEYQAEHFVALLHDALAHPDTPVGSLRLLSERERGELAERAERARAEYPRDLCVHQLFELQVRQTPDNIALIFGEEQLRYEQLNRRANRLARYLLARGVGPESLVAIYLDRSLDLVVSVLAVLKAGAAYVPLDPTFPRERLEFILGAIAAPVVLSQQALASNLALQDGRLITLDQVGDVIALEQSDNLPNRIDSSHLAYVLYTSGSTGKPKGVLVEHSSLTNFLLSMQHEPGITQQDSVLAITTLSFDIAGLELYLPLITGARIILADRTIATDGSQLKALIAQHQVTLLQATPATYRLLHASGWRAELGIKLLCGGEALPGDLARQLCEQAGGVWNMYGPTETTIWSTVASIQAARHITIGHPIANTQIYILDQTLTPLPVGLPGELYIGGAGLARGYLHAASLTAAQFVPDPFSAEPGARLYKTGDLARYLPDGSLEHLGRLDQQVKIRGYRIERGEIETTLRAHPQVQDTAVIAREDTQGDKRLVAYVVLKQGEMHAWTHELREFLRAKLPEYMLPATFIGLSALPLTPSGKLDHRALPTPLDIFDEQASAHAPPETHAEQQLAEIWAELLGRPRVGIHENFFEIGGDSILGMQIVARANQAGLSLTPRDIFQHRTIAELAGHASRLPSQAEQPPEQGTGSLMASVPIANGTNAEIQDVYELSPVQQGLLFHTLYAHEHDLYLVQLSCTLEGQLDQSIFQRAWQRIVDRHQSLRTSFSWRGLDTPLQLVQRSARVPFTLHDWRGLAPEQQDQRLAQMLEQDRQAGFELSQAPLLRVTLMWLDEQRYQLIWLYHHLILDGWSAAEVLKELLLVYEAEVAGQTLELPAPRPYRDYIAWLQRQSRAQAASFWQQRFQDYDHSYTSAMPRQERPQATIKNASVEQHIPAPEADALRAFAQQSRLTLNTLLQAAWALALARHTGAWKVCSGMTVAGRPPQLPGIESMVGMFINTIPVQVDIRTREPVLSWLRRVQDQLVDLREYQHSSLIQIQEWAGMPRGTSLFDSIVVFENYPIHRSLREDRSSLRIKHSEFFEKTHYALSLVVIPGAELTLRLLYQEQLLDHATASALLRHLQGLLEALIVNANQPVSTLPLLNPGEQQQILGQWSVGAGDYAANLCIHTLFEQQAARFPNQPALVFEGQQYGYAELDQRANQLARYLRRQGVHAETLAGIYLDRSPEMIVSLLAILKAGGAYLPLDPTYPQERIVFMIEDAQAPILITQSNLAGALLAPRAQVICLDRDQELIAAEPSDPLNLLVSERQLAYVIYTSGSTGKPRGVQLEHRGLVSLSQAAINTFGITGQSRVLQFASLCFDASVWQIFMALHSGATLYLISRETSLSLAALNRLLREQRISVADLPPSILDLLEPETLPDLLTVSTGGERCTMARALRWSADRRFFNVYGPTETTVAASWELVGLPSASQAVPIGRPVPNTRIYLLGPDLQLVPPGMLGELYIGGFGVARGYLRQPGLSATHFLPDPLSSEPGARIYKTGDMGRYLPDGRIEFIGRSDHQVKIRGFRIELEEIEARLQEHPALTECVVTACERSLGQNELSAYVVFQPGRSATLGELRHFLAERLPGYMVPTAFVVLEAFPRTPSRKIDRNALPALEATRSALETLLVKPTTPTEHAIAQIWCDVLQIEQVGVHDNFFDMGGHSLLSIQLHVKLQAVFGREFALLELFKYPTIATLAGYVDQMTGVAHEAGDKKQLHIDKEKQVEARTQQRHERRALRRPQPTTLDLEG